MIPQNYRTARIEHWKPNDRLHFHGRFRERSPAKNSFNEPYYQYRETKIEHKPNYRTSPTFNSSVFTPQTYDYSVRAQNFKTAPPSEQSSHNHRLSEMGRVGDETSYQKHYQKNGYEKYSPLRHAPLSNTKIGKDY